MVFALTINLGTGQDSGNDKKKVLVMVSDK